MFIIVLIQATYSNFVHFSSLTVLFLRGTDVSNMADCAVDENNLSFSEDEYSSVFITQSTFHAVDTQDVVEMVDFLDNLRNFSCGDCRGIVMPRSH